MSCFSMYPFLEINILFTLAQKKLLKKLVYHCKTVSGFGAYLNLNLIDHVEVFVNRRILNKVKTKT